jgi:hypothetical protein
MTDDRNERAMLQLIDERDAAEECLSQMYYIVTGNSPHWSNLFGHKEALEDVADVVSVLKQKSRPIVTAFPNVFPCMKCGVPEHIHLLDAKAPPDDNEDSDFTVLECIRCYGPGWTCMSLDHLRDSVALELRWHYRWWRLKQAIKRLRGRYA